MSIKKRSLDHLRSVFLENSEFLKDLLKKRDKIGEELENYVKSECERRISKEDLSQLKKISGFFKTCFWMSEGALGKQLTCVFRDIPWTLGFELSWSGSVRCFPEFLSEGVTQKIKEICDIEKKMSDLLGTYERLVNKNTSLAWLKNNLPRVYIELKKYENTVS